MLIAVQSHMKAGMAMKGLAFLRRASSSGMAAMARNSPRTPPMLTMKPSRVIAASAHPVMMVGLRESQPKTMWPSSWSGAHA